MAKSVDYFKQEYEKRLMSGYRVGLFLPFKKKMVTLHFTDESRALEMANYLKDTERYRRVVIYPVQQPWLEAEV